MKLRELRNNKDGTDMKNWKVRIYDCKTFVTVTEMIIPDALA